MFKVTDERVREAYLFLRGLPPFNRWDMPPASKCTFGLLVGASHHAEYVKDGKHLILVNADTHITLTDTLMSVAHEMVHQRQQILGRLPLVKDSHNAEFRRMAKQVCSAMGWELQKF
jgi:hypothetical protein